MFCPLSAKLLPWQPKHDKYQSPSNLMKFGIQVDFDVGQKKIPSKKL